MRLELNKGDMVQHKAFGRGLVLTATKMGNDVLLENVKKGYSLMPPKGMCFTCTDDDLRAVIDWMAH